MKIEIKGVEFSNKGAELMLHSIVAVLEQQLEEFDLVLSPGHLLPYQQRARLGAWQKFSFTMLGVDWTFLGNLVPTPIRRLLRHFGIVVEKDIDVVLDASGFVYSDKWGSHCLKQSLMHLQRVKKRQQQYIFLPQAFGPFEQPHNARLMTRLIELADWVLARDSESLASLKALSDKNTVLCYPDFTPLFDTSAVVLPAALLADLPQKFVLLIPNNKMYSNKPAERKTQYLTFLKHAIGAIESLGLKPVIVNHEGEKDRKLCLQLLESVSNRPLFIDGLSALQVKKLIGMAEFNISSRFHGCVSSLSQGKPTFGTSWGHKYEQLYDYYQCREHLIDIDLTQSQLSQKMKALVDELPTLSAQLQLRAKAHKDSISEMWTQVLANIKQQ